MAGERAAGGAGVGDRDLESPIQVCVGDGSGSARPCSQVCMCSFPCVGQLVAMQDNTGRNSVGVGFRQPVTILMVSLRVMSSFLACALRLHAGEAYSAALYTRARAPVLKVEGLAPHDEPASRRRRLFLEGHFSTQRIEMLFVRQLPV